MKRYHRRNNGCMRFLKPHQEYCKIDGSPYLEFEPKARWRRNGNIMIKFRPKRYNSDKASLLEAVLHGMPKTSLLWVISKYKRLYRHNKQFL